MRALFQFLSFSVLTLACMSWLMVKATRLYDLSCALSKQRDEQRWLLQQCRAAPTEISKYADCSGALQAANMSVWQHMDDFESFLIIPSVICCLLWIVLYCKTLYK